MSTNKNNDIELRIESIIISRKDLLKKLFDKNKKSLLNIVNTYELKVLYSIETDISERDLKMELIKVHVQADENNVPVEARVDFEPKGFSLYRNRSGEIPRFIDCKIALIEDDSKIKSLSSVLMQMSEKLKSFDELLKNLTVIKSQLQKILSNSFFELVLETLEHSKDNILFYELFTLTNKIDGYKNENSYTLKSGDIDFLIKLYVQ